MRNRLSVFLLAAVLAAGSMGCASRAYQVHPGSAGYVGGTPTPVMLFASQSYDALVAADQVIMQTRADFLGNKFPAASMPAIRTAFNGLVNAYDIAQQAWLSFNDAASRNPSVSQAALAGGLAGLQTALTNLALAKGAK